MAASGHQAPDPRRALARRRHRRARRNPRGHSQTRAERRRRHRYLVRCRGIGDPCRPDRGDARGPCRRRAHRRRHNRGADRRNELPRRGRCLKERGRDDRDAGGQSEDAGSGLRAAPAGGAHFHFALRHDHRPSGDDRLFRDQRAWHVSVAGEFPQHPQSGVVDRDHLRGAHVHAGGRRVRSQHRQCRKLHRPRRRRSHGQGASADPRWPSRSRFWSESSSASSTAFW